MTTKQQKFPTEGGCGLPHGAIPDGNRAAVRELLPLPLVSAQSGAAFALNAMIESDRCDPVGAPPELVDTPSESGSGQLIARCRSAKVAVWSHYAGAGPLIKVCACGHIGQPGLAPAGCSYLHGIETAWVVLPEGTPAVPEYYESEKLWPKEASGGARFCCRASGHTKPQITVPLERLASMIVMLRLCRNCEDYQLRYVCGISVSPT